MDFELTPDAFEPREFQTWPFPESWWEDLKWAESQLNRRGSRRSRPPNRRLGRLFRATLPDLLSFDSIKSKRFLDDWLWADTAIETSVLQTALVVWAQKRYDELPDADREALVTSLEEVDWTYEQRTVDIPSGLNASSPADVDDSLYNVLPGLLAAELSDSEATFEPFGASRNLRRIIPEANRQTIELVSWPPERYQGDAFSIRLGLSIQTIPGRAGPRLNVGIGLRRWLSNELDRLGRNRAKCLFSSSWPWSDTTRSPCFHVAPFEAQRTEERERYAWSEHVGEVLSSLEATSSPLPDLEELVYSPTEHLEGDEPVAILYGTHLDSDHAVESGLSAHDLEPIYREVGRLLGPYVEPTDLHDRNRCRGIGCDDIEVYDDMTSVGIRYSERGTARAMVDTIDDVTESRFGDEIDWNDLPLRGRYESGGIQLDMKLLGDLGDGITKASERSHHDLVRERIESIQNREVETDAEVVFVELEGEDAFAYDPDLLDPKDAVRLGMARTGRVTQFVRPASRVDSEHRFEAAFEDGLRQFGISPNLDIPEVLTDIERVVGLWNIARNDRGDWLSQSFHLPVAVSLSLETSEVRAWIPDGHDNWLSYTEALLALGRGEASTVSSDKEVRKHLRKLLSRDLGPESLLVVDSRNLRRFWDSINDQKLYDSFELPGGENWLELMGQPRGLVRLRQLDRGEVPQVYGYESSGGEVDRIGYTKGVFQRTESVYYSVPKKHDSMQISPKLSKFERWKTSSSTNDRSPQPNKAVRNPAPLEMIPVGMAVESKAEWAHLCDTLRYASVQYDDPTRLPLPLHLADKMEEYVRPLGS